MVTMKELKYAIMAAIVLGFSACTNEDDVTGGNYVTDPDAVVVSASIGAPLTRANTEGNGDQFLYTDENNYDIIYVENTGTGKITGKEKGYYRLQPDGNTWTPCDVDGNNNPMQYIVWGNEGSNDFRGVYPATATEPFTLPTDQSSLVLLRSADYMKGAPKTGTDATTKPADKKLSLTFTHQLAKVTVALVFNDQYTGNETINGLNFYLTDGTTSISAYAHNITEGSTTQKAYTAILNPGSYTNTGNTFCTINVAGTELSVKVPTDGITLTAGKAHTLTLHVGKDRINFGSITVNEWGATQLLDDNVADEETDGPDASTHTITTSAEGRIAENPDWIAEAIGEGTELVITGPMSSDDLTAIANYLKNHSDTTIDINLSDAELTAVPDGTFKGLYVESVIDERIKSLGEVSLPATLTEIGEDAFRDCPSFTVANWDELKILTTIKSRAFMGSGLSGEITLPESIKTIERMAFYQTGITSIVFPSDITTIETQMFYRCYSLKKVVLKGDITSFGELVFGACSALEEIDLSACTSMPTYTSNPFQDISSTNTAKITLKVKADLVESFKSDENWGKCNVTAAE